MNEGKQTETGERNVAREQTRKPEPHDDNCQCSYCIPIIDDPTLVTGGGNAPRVDVKAIPSEIMLKSGFGY